MRTILILASTLALLAGAATAQDAPKMSVPPQNKPMGAPDEDPTVKVTGGKPVLVDVPSIKNAPLKTDKVLGDRKAPVVLVEYASLSCPHCAHFSTTILPALEKKYITTGKMAYVLRQFPLNEPALRGAMLLQCVGESSEEKYYTFSRVLFEAQPKWAFDGNFLTGLETIATVGGVSKQQFNACVNNKDVEVKVLEAKKAANDELKIPHTPYVIINGVAYEGEHTVDDVSAAIEQAIASARKK